MLEALLPLLQNPMIQGMLLRGVLSVSEQATSLIDQRFRSHEANAREQRSYEHALAIEHLRASYAFEQDQQNYKYAISLADRQHLQQLECVSEAHQLELKEIDRRHELKLEEMKQDLSNHKDIETLKLGFSKELESFKFNLSLVGLSNRLSMQRLFETYPDSRGPGRLRAGLDMLPEYRANCEVIPPLVLIPPFEDDGTVIQQNHQQLMLWREFRSVAQYYLGQYGSRLHVPPLYPDRSFPWPHDAFYIYDLLGIPTIIVKAAVTQYSLSVFIGGCHLTSFDLGNVQALQPALRLRLRPLQDGKIKLLNPRLRNISRHTSSLSQRSSNSEYSFLEEQDNLIVTEDELIELAAKAIHLCVVKLMDIYYLTTERQYDERFDFALDDEGIQYSAELLNHDLPNELLCDPAYHQLHQFLRFSRLGKEYQANLELSRALTWLCRQCGVPVKENNAEQCFCNLLSEMLSGREIPNNIILHLRKLLEILSLLQLHDVHHKVMLRDLQNLRDAQKLPFTSKGDLI